MSLSETHVWLLWELCLESSWCCFGHVCGGCTYFSAFLLSDCVCLVCICVNFGVFRFLAIYVLGARGLMLWYFGTFVLLRLFPFGWYLCMRDVRYCR